MPRSPSPVPPPLTSESRRHIDFLDAASQAVIATSLDGTVEYWNSEAESLYGWPAGEAVGRNIVDLTPTTQSRESAAEIMNVLASGEVWSGEFEVRSRDGQSFRAAVTDLPVLLGGSLIGIVGASARSSRRSPMAAALERIHAAANKIWPGRFELSVDPDCAALFTELAEPHLVQLLAILVVHHRGSLDEGMTAVLSASAGEPSKFAEFGVPAHAAHLSLSIRGDEDDTAVTREMLRMGRQSTFAARLVALARGRLFVAASPRSPSAYHLFLPAAQK